jgi:hypothetical protein
MILASDHEGYRMIAVFVVAVLFAIPGTILFDQIIRYMYEHRRDIWEAEERPLRAFIHAARRSPLAYLRTRVRDELDILHSQLDAHRTILSAEAPDYPMARNSSGRRRACGVVHAYHLTNR